MFSLSSFFSYRLYALFHFCPFFPSYSPIFSFPLLFPSPQTPSCCPKATQWSNLQSTINSHLRPSLSLTIYVPPLPQRTHRSGGFTTLLQRPILHYGTHRSLQSSVTPLANNHRHSISATVRTGTRSGHGTPPPSSPLLSFTSSPAILFYEFHPPLWQLLFPRQGRGRVNEVVRDFILFPHSPPSPEWTTGTRRGIRSLRTAWGGLGSTATTRLRLVSEVACVARGAALLAPRKYEPASVYMHETSHW